MTVVDIIVRTLNGSILNQFSTEVAGQPNGFQVTERARIWEFTSLDGITYAYPVGQVLLTMIPREGA